MPNPFGGTISGKNTSHTNQANLVYALIPRSTSNIREIITDVAATLSGASVASYDADGYIAGSSSSSNSIATVNVAGLAQSGNITIIAGHKWAGGSPSSLALESGMYRSSETYVQVATLLDGSDRRFRCRVGDGTRDFLPSYIASTSDHIGIAVATSAGAQKGRYVQNTASPPSGSWSSIGTQADTNTGLTMDRLSAAFNSSWLFQYLFVYNAYLSDADIQAIINDPGAVVQQTGLNLPHQLRRGAPRGIARGMQ